MFTKYTLGPGFKVSQSAPVAGLQIYGVPESLSHDFKYDPSLSKAVDPSFLVVKEYHFNKRCSSYSESTNTTKQKVHVGSQYSKPLKSGFTV